MNIFVEELTNGFRVWKELGELALQAQIGIWQSLPPSIATDAYEHWLIDGLKRAGVLLPRTLLDRGTDTKPAFMLFQKKWEEQLPEVARASIGTHKARGNGRFEVDRVIHEIASEFELWASAVEKTNVLVRQALSGFCHFSIKVQPRERILCAITYFPEGAQGHYAERQGLHGIAVARWPTGESVSYEAMILSECKRHLRQFDILFESDKKK